MTVRPIEVQRTFADPLLLGFMKDVPYIFLLGRWSGTGIFPGIQELIAGTMEHLETHRDALSNIRGDTPWHHSKWACLHKSGGIIKMNHVLVPFAEQVLDAFGSGKLFSLLRDTDIRIAQQ